MKCFRLGMGLLFLLSSSLKGQDQALLHYKSCGESFFLSQSPQKAMSMDINTTEIMLSLGLAPRMIAIAGVAKGEDILPHLRKDFDSIPKIEASYPTLESLVRKKPDFIFGGWQYGFSEGTGVTPRRLKKFGIDTYALNESCIRIQARREVSLDDVFEDVRSIGKIFGKESRAKELIEGYRRTLATFPRQPSQKPKPRVFLYDSGEASPYTSGRFAMPQAMMDAAHVTNIFADVRSSWTSVSWEEVIARRPEFIIIVDYGDKTAEQKIQFLEAKFRGTSLDVMKRKRYLVLPYAAVTPGVRTVGATEELIRALEQHFPRAGS